MSVCFCRWSNRLCWIQLRHRWKYLPWYSWWQVFRYWNKIWSIENYYYNIRFFIWQENKVACILILNYVCIFAEWQTPLLTLFQNYLVLSVQGNSDEYEVDYTEFGSSNDNIRWYSPYISHTRQTGNLKKNKKNADLYIYTYCMCRNNTTSSSSIFRLIWKRLAKLQQQQLLLQQWYVETQEAPPSACT